MYQKSVLANGLRIVTQRIPHTHSATLSIFIGVGSRYESPGNAGISHFIEHMLFRGTTRRPTSRDISDAIEDVGGVLNGATDRESTVYWCKVPYQHLEMGIEVLSDMLLNARFEMADIEKERTVILEELHIDYDDPTTHVNDLIEELIWPAHPVGHSAGGKKESVGSIQRRHLLDYMRRHYCPGRTVAAIAGNIKHQDAVELVGKYLSGWAAAKPCPEPAPYRPVPGERLRVEYRPTAQTHLCLGLPGASLRDPRRHALDLISDILGQGMSSRLFARVRDELGLAYEVECYTEELSDTGALVVYAGVETTKLETALKAILAELARIKDESVSETRLNKVREMTRGRLNLRLDDSQFVADWLGSQEVITGQIITAPEVMKALNALTAADIQKVAGEFISVERMSLVIVGPVKKTTRLRKLINAQAG